MTANHNGLTPMRNQPRYILNDDWLTEDNSAKNVANSSVWGLPHLFEIELFYAGLIRSDGCALNSNAMLLYCIRTIDCDLVISGVAILNSKVVVLKIYIKVGKDELFFDEVPDDSGHLIAI